MAKRKEAKLQTTIINKTCT